MDLLYIFTSVFLFIFLIRNTLFWLHLWQIKEYRLDRILIHLRETTQGKNLIFGVENSIKNVAFFIYLLFSFSLGIGIGSWYNALVFLIFFVSFIKVVREIKDKSLRFPPFTPKIVFIMLVVIGIELLLYLIPSFNQYFWLIFLDRLVPFFVATFMGILAVPSDVYKDILIQNAIKKLRKARNLLVIGITGSYGKGSTKEFLATVFSCKWNVLQTFGTFNTPVGIAKTISTGLSHSTEIFIAEMGAYKRGEIAQMCEMVKPKIGILTSVNNQHVSLFGNLDNTMSAKYELIQSLPSNGLALFNGNNSNSLKLSQKTKKKVVYYADYKTKGFASSAYDNSNKGKFDIRAFNIKVSKFYIEFDLELLGKPMSSFKVSLVGKQNVENILPAIYVAHYLGMTTSDIAKALQKILPLSKTMEPFTTEKGAVLIDDTYNANPASVFAAVEYMRIYRGKKVFVLQPMIELGKNAYNDHLEIAQQIGKVCDYLIVTNQNFFDAIKKGMRKTSISCKPMNLDPKRIADLAKNLGKEDVVVFEGKEAGASLGLINRKSIY